MIAYKCFHLLLRYDFIFWFKYLYFLNTFYGKLFKKINFETNFTEKNNNQIIKLVSKRYLFLLFTSLKKLIFLRIIARKNKFLINTNYHNWYKIYLKLIIIIIIFWFLNQYLTKGEKWKKYVYQFAPLVS